MLRMEETMGNAIQENHRLGQATWLDYLRRGLLRSGEFAALIEQGISGVTSNPTIFEKAMTGSTDYDEELVELARLGKEPLEIYETLALGDVGSAADFLRPWHESSGGADGFASIEISPRLADDTDASVEEASRYFDALSRPNVMIKIPGTAAGIPAIRRLTAQGINVNITLLFGLTAYASVREAYLAGLREFTAAGGDPRGVHSVASFFLSRVDTAVDGILQARIDKGERSLTGLLGKAALANAKLAYRDFLDTFAGDEFLSLQAVGARRQRPLWASTGTKNPAYSDVMYVQPLIGPDTVNTMPQATFQAWLDHGQPRLTLEEGIEESRQHLDDLAEAGIDMGLVTASLLEDGIKLFSDSLDKVLANIQDKVGRLLTPTRIRAGVSLAGSEEKVQDELDGLMRSETVGRLWRKDYRLWQDDPSEISDRLGWLNVTEVMADQVGSLGSFADEVRNEAYGDVVLCGMGGSSLGPEVLRQVFASGDVRPRLTVLDSTVPETIAHLAETLDPARTLFLVSSKSGGTLETMSLYHYFRQRVGEQLGEPLAGANFVAITDPGTSLQEAGERGNFRRVFLNPTDIGGRFSVLSYFGLVPAALLGIDLMALLDRADRMREACASCVPTGQNPGAWLGAVMAGMAQTGRDKLTLLASPALASFGLWVEQLIAESTGKQGTGILPVVGEPLLEAPAYGADRFFVYLRLEGDDNAHLDDVFGRLKGAGHPVIGLEVKERYELGGEFFRWEFAVAVAGALMDIHPFNQPDVQAAKRASVEVLREYQTSGELGNEVETDGPRDLLDEAVPGDYLSLLVYAEPSADLVEALNDLRATVMRSYGLATTLGWGPRYLHSTGQFHKGGAGNGLFLLVTCASDLDLEIPGETYSFGTLLAAQARGDLQALLNAGRRVSHVHIAGNTASRLRDIAREIDGGVA